MPLSLPKWFPLFILASSVRWSLQCLISALTQGGKGDHLFRLFCSVLLWGGRNTANKYHWRVWEPCAVSQLHWICPCSRCVCFFQSTLLRLWVALWAVGPGLHALPRSKPLRFRLSGTPQTHRLFPGSSGDQVLGQRTLLRCGASYHLLGISHLVLGCTHFRCAMCFF